MTTLAKLKNAGYDEDRIKLDRAVFDEAKNECTVNFVYNPSLAISQSDKKQIQEIFEGDLADVCLVKVKFNKAYFDEDVLKKLIFDYFQDNYKALSLIFTEADITIAISDMVYVEFRCDTITKQVLENKDFITNLENYLNTKTFASYSIKLVEKTLEVEPSHTTYDDSLERCLAEEELINRYEVKTGDILIGKPNEFPVVCLIKKMPLANGESVALAGEIKNIRQATFTRKSDKEGAKEREITKVSLTLKDVSGEIGVVWFPKPEEMDLISKLEEGKEVIVCGVVSNFKDNVNVKLQSVWECEILTKELKKVYRKVNNDYTTVFPAPVTEVTQMDLFNLTDKLSPYWDTHDEVVVFDFETTGLSPKNCNIIEIGAVKVKKGSIIQTFQTLINPKEVIPEEITEITHITNEMVANAPSIEEVLPDFYKFTYGAVLSAYNIDFDYQFLSRDGDKLRLLFDNEQIDTLKLARDKVPSLSNYKLATVVKALGITLNNAHRALADAYATAKVFVKLI